MARVRRAPRASRPTRLVLLSVGRLEENKGFHVLAAALAALRDHSPAIAAGRWRWVLVGDGPFRAARSSHRRRAGSTAARCCRPRRRPRRCTPGTRPRAVRAPDALRGQLAGHARGDGARPARSSPTDAGGLPDKVVTGVNGWLVPAGRSRSALAAAISGALGPDVDLAALGARGRVIVEQEFSWHAAGDATISLYEALLGRVRN